MGLESYRFCVVFDHEIGEVELDEVLLSCGLRRTKKEGDKLSDYREYFYELITNSGITEVHTFFSPQQDKIDDFSLRFSIASPTAVIHQTFELLNKLNGKKSLRVRDVEIYNHVYED